MENEGASSRMSGTTKSHSKEDTLVTDEDLMQTRRTQVFEDWEAGRYDTITELCERHGFSRRWFYRWKPRWEAEGPDGMRSRPPGPDEAPNATPGEVLGRILEHVEEHPAHGCDRIALELEDEIAAMTVQRYLRRWDLRTVEKRLQFHRIRHGKVLTEEEISAWHQDRQKSQHRHVEVSSPGELVGMDLFYIGTLKGIGRIYQFTGVDCFSSFGFAGIYPAKTTDNAIRFVRDRVVPHFSQHPLQRVLTDNGKEFTTHWEDGSHRFTKALASRGIRQTTTKVKHPWTNGHAERLQQTLLKEFYQTALQETRYRSIEALQRDLDDYLVTYNFHRPHQGRRTSGKTPAEVFFGPTRQPALEAA